MLFSCNTHPPATSGSSGGSGPSMADTLSSCVFDIDITQSGCYDGSQTLSNLVSSPADGSNQSDYDFYLGADASASSDDPTINNNATQSAEIVFDGGDLCGLKASSVPVFLRDMLKTGSGKKYTFAMCLTRNSSTTSYALGFGDVGISKIGFGVWTTASGSITFVEHRSSFSSKILANVNVPATPSILIFSYDETARTLRYWVNTRTKRTMAFNHDANSTNLDDIAHIGAIDYNGSKYYAGSNQKTYAVSAFDEYIDDAQAEDIIDAYNTRHGRTYA